LAIRTGHLGIPGPVFPPAFSAMIMIERLDNRSSLFEYLPDRESWGKVYGMLGADLLAQVTPGAVGRCPFEKKSSSRGLSLKSSGWTKRGADLAPCAGPIDFHL